MIKHIFLINLVVLAVLGCSKMQTKQFIVPYNENGPKPEGILLRGWEITTPQLIAYKNIKEISDIKNPNMFWLTIRAYHDSKGDEVPGERLVIDTVVFNLPGSRQEKRMPSRVATFKNNKGNKFILAADYFRDGGIEIGNDVSQITLTFDARVLNSENEELERRTLSFEMFRDEGDITVPLSGWR